MVIPDWIYWGVPVATLLFAGIGILALYVGVRRFERKFGHDPK
jgi:ABC-type multidrug transport system permease subunit